MKRDDAALAYYKALHINSTAVKDDYAPEWVYRQIDAFAAIGMISFETEESDTPDLTDRLIDILGDFMDWSQIYRLQKAFYKAGLRIVEK